MLFPGIVNHSEGDTLLKCQRYLACAVLHRLLDVHHHVHAFYTVGKRDKDILIARLFLINLIDERQCLLAHQLRLPVIRLKSFLEQLVSEVVDFAVFEFLFIERRLDAHI